MANEFKARNGFIAQNNSVVTGSLTVTGGITGSFTGSLTGSLFGTSSYATQALSASYAPDTTFPYTGSAIITGSLVLTGSFNALVTGSNFVNIGNYASPNNLRLVTIGQDTAYMSFGSLVGTTSQWAFYGNQATPSATNPWAYGTSTDTFINAGLSAGNVYIQAGGNTLLRVAVDRFVAQGGAQTSGAQTNFTFTKPNNTGQTASTPINGFLFTTGNRQWNTGAITTQKEFEITSPTYTFVGASTITNAYTLYVNKPTAGTNATLGNNNSIGADGAISAGFGSGGGFKINTNIFAEQNGTGTVSANGLNIGNGFNHIVFIPQVANTSGAITQFTFTLPSVTGQTASTEIPNFKVTGNTKTWANGGGATTISAQRWNWFSSNTAATSGGGSLTITDSYALYAEAATASGVTITNNYAIGTSGNVYFGVGTVTSGVKFMGQVGTTTNAALYLDQSSPSATNYALRSNGTATTILNATTQIDIDIANSLILRVTSTGLTLDAAKGIIFNTVSGGYIGTATTQKIGFWNATPIIQPTSSTAIDTLLTNIGLRASGGSSNFDTPITASIISGSSITGSLLGTASYSAHSLTASYASTASYALTAQTLLGSVTSASYSATASYVVTAQTASYYGGSVTSASYASTASYSTTASFLLGSVTSASYAETASYVVNSISSSFASTASFVVTSQTASFYGGSVTSASYASTASYVNGNITKANIAAAGTFGGTPLTASITFSTAFPNTNYTVTVTGEDARIFTIQNKLAGGFEINTNSNVALTGDTHWQAISYGEFNS